MNYTLTGHIDDLVETLRDLRHRFRQTARFEVARAIGEALREVTLAVICGPARFPTMGRPSSTAWDNDPWQETPTDPWATHDSFPEEEEFVIDAPEQRSRLTVSPAIMAGLGMARWSYLRTRRPGLATSLGILVTLAAYVGGPTLQSLLKAWSVSQDLLNFPGADHGR